MTSLIHPCPKRALIPLEFELIFNYDTFFKVAQSYPHGPKLAQLTVVLEISGGWGGGGRICRPQVNIILAARKEYG